MPGDPDPDVMWFRGHKEIRPIRRYPRIRTDWDPRTDEYILTIKDATIEDAAMYKVKAVNKYGTLVKRAEVIVGDVEVPSDEEEIEEEEVKMPKQKSPPAFIKPIRTSPPPTATTETPLDSLGDTVKPSVAKAGDKEVKRLDVDASTELEVRHEKLPEKKKETIDRVPVPRKVEVSDSESSTSSESTEAEEGSAPHIKAQTETVDIGIGGSFKLACVISGLISVHSKRLKFPPFLDIARLQMSRKYLFRGSC